MSAEIFRFFTAFHVLAYFLFQHAQEWYFCNVDTALLNTLHWSTLLQIIGSPTPVRVTHQIPIKMGKPLSKNSHQLSYSSIQFEHVTMPFTEKEI